MNELPLTNTDCSILYICLCCQASQSIRVRLYCKVAAATERVWNKRKKMSEAMISLYTLFLYPPNPYPHPHLTLHDHHTKGSLGRLRWPVRLDDTGSQRHCCPSAESTRHTQSQQKVDERCTRIMNNK